mmetsp:Transcript_59074/g.105395  ORF Transcript_59074/g.105395 Transcript_59074/m.105395 type:complete len:202 (+) Transcript_59074:1580-2185(+)
MELYQRRARPVSSISGPSPLHMTLATQMPTGGTYQAGLTSASHESWGRPMCRCSRSSRKSCKRPQANRPKMRRCRATAVHQRAWPRGNERERATSLPKTIRVMHPVQRAGLRPLSAVSAQASDGHAMHLVAYNERPAAATPAHPCLTCVPRAAGRSPAVLPRNQTRPKLATPFPRCTTPGVTAMAEPFIGTRGCGAWSGAP